MMRYIILLLLLSSTLTAQTKLRQIERSATKWHVPAAWDSIPGVTGHAMKYIDLETLMDTVGIQQFGIDSLDYRNDSLLIWVGGGYYFAIIPQGLMGSGDDGSVAYWHQDTIAGDTVHFWDRSNKRLGLNTKTPSSLLHVKKNEYALPVAEFDNPGTNGQTVLIKHGSSSDGRYPLKIQTPAATSYFDARGYLGLGVSPSYPLHVKNTTGISRFENTNSNGDAGFDLYHTNKWWRIAMNAEGGTTNNVHFRDITGSRYPLTLQSSNGYVGILNLTPARELHVTGRVRVSTLDSDLTPPTTAGPTKMVITDESGDLSFANIPTIPVDSTVVTQGYGITVTESPTNTYNVKSDTSKMATVWDVSQVDQSVTNELQTLSHASTSTTHTTTLSNSGGSLILKEGSNVTLTTSGNEVTIASTASGGGIDSTIIIGGYGITSVESPLNTFNIVADTTQMQRRIVLSTNGTSGPATLTGSLNLNIPQYGNGDITGITTTAPITGGTTSGNATLGLSYDATYMGLNGSSQLYPLYNVATWNANSFRGRNISITAPTNGQVYSWDATSSLWVPSTISTSTQNLGYTSSPTNGLVTISGGGTSATVPLATTTNAGLLKPLSNSSTQFLNGLGNWTTPSGIVTDLGFTGVSSPYTLTSSTGADVTFTAGSNVTLSVTGGNNLTISAPNAGGTNLSFGILNNGGTPSSYGDFVMIDNSSGSDIYLHDGDGIDMVRSASNYSGYKLNQSYANLLRTTNVGVAITSTDTNVDFVGGFENGNMTYSTVNDNITLSQAGTYDIEFSSTVYTTGTTTRRAQFTLFVNTTAFPDVLEIIQDVDAVKYESVQRSRVYVSAAGSAISIKVKYDSTIGSGTDIYYRWPSLKITRLK